MVVRKITCHSHSLPFVCNCDHMPSPDNCCVTNHHWHFNPGPICCQFSIREHLQLMTTGDDSQALFDWSSSHSAIIVDNDTVRATNEVSHQQVRTAARASKVKEATIKRHEMLGTSQTRMTCITLDSNNCILDESATVTANKSQQSVSMQTKINI